MHHNVRWNLQILQESKENKLNYDYFSLLRGYPFAFVVSLLCSLLVYISIDGLRIFWNGSSGFFLCVYAAGRHVFLYFHHTPSLLSI